MTAAPTDADLQAIIDDLVGRHSVMGASLAVCHRGEVTTAAAGTANARTGVAMTPATHVLIGSTTKTYTTTMVMQLVAEGALDLDTPVADLLPDVELASGIGRRVA